MAIEPILRKIYHQKTHSFLFFKCLIKSLLLCKIGYFIKINLFNIINLI